MASREWDPSQYARFAAERSQPFFDLLDLIESGGASAPMARAVDLGCGSGELTAEAARRFGVREMVGVDSSPAMLDAAAAHAGDGLSFVAGDIAEWTAGGDHDLVLANAALHWVPDHPAVLARWAAGLAPGGALAVQVPANSDHPSHTCAGAVAEREPFRSAFDGDVPPDPVTQNVLAPEDYATLLHDLGLRDVHVRLQVYGHLLDSTADVVEWTKGTTLTRFFKRLPHELHDVYLDAYRRELLGVLGERSPYLFPFKRILFRARRP